ncbi:MAG: hypothetical protein PHU46_02750 [Rhodocyclaceae bacterium]|nr:hypothetical protein [Rhodocyclaceae bacterium]
MEELFDRVIGRRRLTGNTVLIAGTDLVSRTLEAGEPALSPGGSARAG